MYYIITPTKGLQVLAQKILFKKGYVWADGLTEIRTEWSTKTLCIGTRGSGIITELDETGEVARRFMRNERPGSVELNMSELNKLEGV